MCCAILLGVLVKDLIEKEITAMTVRQPLEICMETPLAVTLFSLQKMQETKFFVADCPRVESRIHEGMNKGHELLFGMIFVV